MKILVIIVTYNAMQWAKRCFKSLYESSIKADIFVIDNGSTDGTQAYIHEYYPKIIFQQSKENLGFGRANNIGLQYAIDNDYDYVYLLNQDAWVMPDTFEELIETSKKHSEYGILSPFQMNADMVRIDAKFIRNVCSWKSNKNIFNDFYNQTYNEIYPVQGVMAAHWLITKECLRKVGGFSPSFPHYGEDDNYIERVSYYGFKIGIVPSLRVVHDRGERTSSSKEMIYMGYIYSIIRLSSPYRHSAFTIANIVNKNIRLALKYSSIKPINNIFKVFLHVRGFLKNREMSITHDTAFLNIENK